MSRIVSRHTLLTEFMEQTNKNGPVYTVYGQCWEKRLSCPLATDMD